RFPVQTRQQVLALEEQAEGGDGDHVVGRARADHDDVAAGAGELPGGLDGGGFADDFEAVVEAAAAGEFGEGGGDFVGGDGVGGADLLGQFVLGLERVDGEDGAGSGDARALDHGEADAAAADDGDGGAGADLGGVDGGADAGGDAAADERGGFPRHFGVDLHHADGRDHDLFGPGAAAGHAVGGGVGAEAEVALGEGLDDVLHAQERLPAEAQVAFLAGGPPADHDVVAGLDGADVFADFHDLARAFVAGDERHGLRQHSRHGRQVGVADACRLDPYADVGGPDRGQGDVVADVQLVVTYGVQERGAHGSSSG